MKRTLSFSGANTLRKKTLGLTTLSRTVKDATLSITTLSTTTIDADAECSNNAYYA